jgi:hypothetical protein
VASATSNQGMDELPDDVLLEIREHVIAGRLEWELWLRDREEQRLRSAVREHAARLDACDE